LETSEEFKDEVRDICGRLGISSKSLYLCLLLGRERGGKDKFSEKKLRRKIVSLKSDLKRAEEDRVILKMVRCTLPRHPGKVRVR
jgi:transposase-like protein